MRRRDVQEIGLAEGFVPEFRFALLLAAEPPSPAIYPHSRVVEDIERLGPKLEATLSVIAKCLKSAISKLVRFGLQEDSCRSAEGQAPRQRQTHSG